MLYLPDYITLRFIYFVYKQNALRDRRLEALGCRVTGKLKSVLCLLHGLVEIPGLYLYMKTTFSVINLLLAGTEFSLKIYIAGCKCINLVNIMTIANGPEGILRF